MNSQPSILLVFPPVVRPTEPPPGLAAIAGVLKALGIRTTTWDANLDGLLFLLARKPVDDSVWSTQAFRKFSGHLADIRSGKAFRNFDAYKRAIRDFCRLLGKNECTGSEWFVSLTDCEHVTRKPYRLADLIWAFEHPEENPFFTALAGSFRERLAADMPTAVGFSLNYLSQALTTFAMAGFLRREFPHVKIVLGGSLTACWLANYPEIERNFPFVDGMFGESGEEVIPGFLNAGKPFAPAGLFSAVPDFSGFPLNKYLSPGIILPISLTRGCYWKTCAFCAEQAENRDFRAVAAKTLIPVLSELKETYRPALFHFADSSLPPNLLKVLAENPVGVPWYGFIRFIDEFLDPDFCLRLRRAGCVMLQLGLESGNENVLRGMQKGIVPEHASQALRNLKMAGIGTFVYILFGTPFETLAEARDTREFLRTHAREIDYLNLAIFSLPIGVPEAGRLVTRPFSDGDLHLYYEFSHPAGWNRNEVRRFLEQEIKMDPLLRPIVLREPPSFTSNHAPFFLPSPLSAAFFPPERKRGRENDKNAEPDGNAVPSLALPRVSEPF
jgi:hypothetical protein